MPALALSDRTVIHIGGADAQHFLQNLITTNVETIASDQARPAALLTPQGKILFDFLISRAPSPTQTPAQTPESGYLIDIDKTLSDDFIKRLTLYKLRAKVTIEKRADVPIHAGWGSQAPEGALTDQRFPQTANVWRLYTDYAGENGDAVSWTKLRIAHGVAESGHDFALSDIFGHDILMDKNYGIDFRKGCYVGQEVVSRMQHRGTARKRVVTVQATGPLPEAGTPLLAGDKPLGNLATTHDDQALAIVRTDRAAEAMAANQAITADGVAVTLALPEWTGLSFTRTNGTETGESN